MSGPVLRVDLDRLAANIRVARARIAPSELMLVVKDDAYGHGLDAVVDRAAAEGVVWFGAFDVVTGLRVRALAGDAVRVFTWLPAGGADLAAAVDARLDIGVTDLDTLEAVAVTVAAAQGIGEGGIAARVHLEVDSGLHRSGTRPEEWRCLVDVAAQYADDGLVEVVGIFSHLAEASDADDDAARAVFDEAVGEARAAGLHPELLHLTASAASFARPELRYDLSRVGAFCYGIRPEGGPSEAELGIVPVATLEASVVAVSEVAVTLAVGATHGMPSLLGRRAHVATPAGLRLVEHVGDHATLVAAWPGARVGDTIPMWGADAAQSATDLAELIGTIGEEIAVRVSPRVPRRY